MASPLAGFRTFPLITVSGTMAALLGQSFGGWIGGAGLLALAGLIIVGNLAKQKKGDLDPGLTTEVAMLLMYGVGAYLVVGQTGMAIAIGGGVAVLLHLKPEMHSLAARIGNAAATTLMSGQDVASAIEITNEDRRFPHSDCTEPDSPNRECWQYE